MKFYFGQQVDFTGLHIQPFLLTMSAGPIDIVPEARMRASTDPTGHQSFAWDDDVLLGPSGNPATAC